MQNETKAIVVILYDPTSTPDAVAQAGDEMSLTMCQAPPSERDLNNRLREILHQNKSQSCFTATDHRCSQATLFHSVFTDTTMASQRLFQSSTLGLGTRWW
ncbi:hypothetical protein PR048_029882 [Dryococelus australis]|uniref:Uncharacterized protein n=1 Tax=Dryococelus australis TaxID=614101 RepID=A0ABQ9GBB9_9NEOP|nr:hypothetical protein PR048_029882 [Dryococelus australis]